MSEFLQWNGIKQGFKQVRPSDYIKVSSDGQTARKMEFLCRLDAESPSEKSPNTKPLNDTTPPPDTKNTRTKVKKSFHQKVKESVRRALLGQGAFGAGALPQMGLLKQPTASFQAL